MPILIGSISTGAKLQLKKITPNLKTPWKTDQIFNNFKKKRLNSQICISKTKVILYVSFSVYIIILHVHVLRHVFIIYSQWLLRTE